MAKKVWKLSVSKRKSRMMLGRSSQMLKTTYSVPISRPQRSVKRSRNGNKLRVRKACDSCHFRKIKCGEQRPCVPCAIAGKTCLDGSSEERKSRSRRNSIKKLADKLNRHKGQPCNRQEGCLRPFRHPGHCRKGPARKRKRRSKYVAALEAAAAEQEREALEQRTQANDLFDLEPKRVEDEGSDVPEVDIQDLLEARSSQDTWLTEAQSSQDTF
mmetsp:Transcript_32064/g.59693  ORF Transcript_32064/g.59693 Transcript_32064/m.59693 type:complete len:214 (+) Transcript_32064:187-828(+)